MKQKIIIAVLLLSGGCSDEFNPVAEGERPYVVFALLNTASQTQIVRVHETAPPSEPSPGSPPIPGTTVSMTGPEGVIVFRDTVLIPPPGSAATDTINAFVADPFTPSRGATYSLAVMSPRGPATATMTVPEVADLNTSGSEFVLRNPYSYSTEKGISLQILLSRYTLGYLARLLIEYERFEGGVWITERIEVPSVYRELVDENNFSAIYPQLIRRGSLIVTSPGGLRDPESTTFRNSAYLQTLSILYRTYGLPNLHMKRALFILSQADTHFFTYYSLANFFQDKLTIRVDQPDYSNISGALGFFGSMTTDTLAYTLPQSLAPPLP